MANSAFSAVGFASLGCQFVVFGVCVLPIRCQSFTSFTTYGQKVVKSVTAGQRVFFGRFFTPFSPLLQFFSKIEKYKFLLPHLRNIKIISILKVRIVHIVYYNVRGNVENV